MNKNKTVNENETKNVHNLVSLEAIAYNDRMNVEIAALQNNKDRNSAAMQNLQGKLPALVDVLGGLRLEISDIGTSKTGLGQTWEAADKLRVEIIAVPVTKAAHSMFLPFRGYTAEGKGKNEKSLKAKADRLQDLIKAAIVTDFVQVNGNSFEVRDRAARILITLWIA